MCVLVAAVESEPTLRRNFEVDATPRLSIWPRFWRFSRIGEVLGVKVTATMGRLTCVSK